MKAMILAAGRGVRMRPLTDSIPKPLLPVCGRPLVVHLIGQLRRAGFEDIVINVAHLGALIERALGDGTALGVRVTYSREAVALETAGGIAAALPLLGEGPFVVANGDIYSDFAFERLIPVGRTLSHGHPAHLVLVRNPPHHAAGDFCLRDGVVAADDSPRLTFAGIGAYHPALFATVAPGSRHALAPLLQELIARGRVTGERHEGLWHDVGTPERLAELERRLSGHSQTSA
jgi:MurNAc alpha-1-phosphate uridylyltransferase